MPMKYDAIIIGARCAGSPTAMLLAAKGYKVLLLDKAVFPSDTISSHIIFPNGINKLKNWGLLDKLLTTNCQVIHEMGFDVGPFVLKGNPPMGEFPGIIAPRRFILDQILLDAAIEAGAEFRDQSVVEDLIVENGTVTGVRYQSKGGSVVTEHARIVIGADGKNSIVAKKVKAEKYNEVPARTNWYYTYYSNMPVTDLTLRSREARAFGGIPTNNGMTCVTVAFPPREFKEFRSDIEGNYYKSIALDPYFYEVVRNGKQEERFFGMTDNPNFFRKPFGPGWALAGDAGYTKDPITGQGISDAFRDAAALAKALDDGFSGKQEMERALESYQKTRDEQSLPIYGLTCEWAKLEPPPADMQQLLFAMREKPEHSNRFFGVLAGTVPVSEFFSPDNIQRIMSPEIGIV
jgi:flavin-dependent dehydrogenase